MCIRDRYQRRVRGETIAAMPGGTDMIIGMERTLRDKEIQVSHLMAVVYEEQNRTQDKQDQVLRLDAERLQLGRKLAEMESIKRLHIAELEARNRAMGSELDTSRMELDNKIREKRELMQAHAAYIEEMERQHANRVDELDTLVQQYRGKIWTYEAKMEGLQKSLDDAADAQEAAASAHHVAVDLDQFATTSDETLESVIGKNEALLQELESAVSDLNTSEIARDLARGETADLRTKLAQAEEALAAQSAYAAAAPSRPAGPASASGASKPSFAAPVATNKPAYAPGAPVGAAPVAAAPGQAPAAAAVYNQQPGAAAQPAAVYNQPAGAAQPAAAQPVYNQPAGAAQPAAAAAVYNQPGAAQPAAAQQAVYNQGAAASPAAAQQAVYNQPAGAAQQPAAAQQAVYNQPGNVAAPVEQQRFVQPSAVSQAEAVVQQASMLSQQAAQPSSSSEREHYADLRKKLLHTCVSLLEEFDDNRCKTAHDLLEEAEADLPAQQ
eukprot:TRINITY_DN13769_c0_g1_i10.p1 TRINITY_DN13769_c0_g1~~TRINITY_DN13769_c0_g1_i10.p1  ORF type:complete len:496 (+),score=181.85 TRINITY_DN13769_c0_g1_i10:137-1624(+)